MLMAAATTTVRTVDDMRGETRGRITGRTEKKKKMGKVIR